MHKLYELKEMLCKELEDYGSRGKLDVGALDVVDKLAHSIKNIEKIIEAYERGEYSGNMSYERGGYRDGRSYEGRSYDGRSYEGSYDGSYARRDSRGRYSRTNKSLVAELREMMESAPDERTRKEFERFISKVDEM